MKPIASYDATNGVLRVRFTDDPVEGIAVPLGEVTVVLSEDLSVAYELVFEHVDTYLAKAVERVERRRATEPEASDD